MLHFHFAGERSRRAYEGIEKLIGGWPLRNKLRDDELTAAGRDRGSSRRDPLCIPLVLAGTEGKSRTIARRGTSN